MDPEEVRAAPASTRRTRQVRACGSGVCAAAMMPSDQSHDIDRVECSGRETMLVMPCWGQRRGQNGRR